MADRKPKTGPKAKDPTSKTQQRIAARTAAVMARDPKMKQRRDDFIDGLLQGMTRKAAAIYAGVPSRSSSKEASTMMGEPYVQEKLRELREAMDEENLITRKELLLNVKSVAFDESELGGVRVSGSALLSKMMGWDAPSKVEAEVNHKGGVMQVPFSPGTEDWEKAAEAAQKHLKEDVRT